MPRNAGHGISTLFTFIAFIEAYFNDRESLSIGKLQARIKKLLLEYHTNRRLRSTKRPLEIMDKYGLIEKSVNKFSEPTFTLKGITDDQKSIFINILAFLDDVVYNEIIIDRIEAMLPWIFDGVLGYFPKIAGKEDILIRVFNEIGDGSEIYSYNVISWFHEVPTIMRIYTILSWLVDSRISLGNEISENGVFKSFLKLCFITTREFIGFAMGTRSKSGMITSELISKKRLYNAQFRKRLSNVEPYLPEVVRKKFHLTLDSD